MDSTRVRVADVRDVGPKAVAVELSDPGTLGDTPGQFLRITVETADEPVAGYYTISSPPNSDTVELTVDRRPDGTVGRRVAGLSAGDEVTIAGPYGTACYDGESAVLAIAGGPGVGAALAVAEHAVADGGTAALVYRDEEPMHERRLATLASAGCAVWMLVRDNTIRRAVSDALRPDHQAFVYGYEPFLPVATDALRAAGGSPETAKIENYG